jgi:hypothetical protein
MKQLFNLSLTVSLLTLCAGAHAQPVYVATPTNVFGAGLTNLVPDMLVWWHVNGYITNGPIAQISDQVGDTSTGLGTWEPNISVMGDSTFLIGKNTFASDGTQANQNYVVVFQPIAGGAPKIGYEFYDDAGAPFKGQINLSRQNGNPQRVAGDKRPGATNFLTMAETSIGQLASFQSASRTADPFRWDRNPIYGGGDATARYVTVQAFSLNPSTLAQTPLTKGFDAVYGAYVTNQVPASAQQVSRTGGTAAGLDNGNFVVVIDDKTSYLSDSGETATAAIMTPTGTIVKGPWLVDSRDIWDNVCAYSGGFAVRCHDTLYFYDNAGTLQSSTNINTSSGLTFGTGREDGSRIASDIRSHFVYLAGETPESAGHNPCSVAIWDARTGKCVATNEVTDTDPSIHKMDRVNVAVDAADHFCVAYAMSPDPTFWTQLQVAARVGKFDGTNVTWLTPSFFPFVNSENDPGNVQGFITVNPSVAMTTQYICIAAKGTVNVLNDPTGGPNSAAETALYTVLSTPYVPGSIESVGLKRIVPDTPVIVPPADALGNWEPYTSVLGNSTFLIEANTFATNDLNNQRYVVYFQPAAGGAGKLGDSFFSDDGKAFRDAINLSRQNGNPGRVAGDRRPGATTILTAGETSAGQIAAFQAASRTADPFRWDRNLIYGGGDPLARYVTVEAFSLDPVTLAQTPLTKAFDAVYGNFVTNQAPVSAQQVSRTGGTAAFLDNGNVVVVIDDKTSYLSESGETATASIVTPTGTVVKGPWLIDPRDIWDNVSAYQGGFAVRVHDVLYFYDNAGSLKGQTNILGSGRNFQTGRGDETRIASHINSHFVYLVGSPSGAHVVSMAVFDARDQSFVTVFDVSEPGFQASTDRAAVAVDALDRVICVWESQPTGYGQPQTAGRVLKFDPVARTVSPLTSSFWTFINTAQTGGIRAYRMNASMTTRQICVAAKGEINLQNKPALGTNSPVEINFFTVFTHPDPKDDPTVSIGGLGPTLSASLSGKNLTLSWPTSAGLFNLQSTPTLSPSAWANLTPQPTVVPSGNLNQMTVPLGSGSAFFRLAR